jgi:hypothetical protein
MKKHSTSSAMILFFSGLFAMMTMQCSSSRQNVGVTSSPDVSQVPIHSGTSGENNAVAKDLSQSSEWHISQLPDESNHHDSSKAKTESPAGSPRILHFSEADFSIYDTRSDSAFLKSDKHRLFKKSKVDSVTHNTDVGILTPAEVRHLTLNLAKAEIICLSLVNSDLFENFEKDDLEQKFAQYGAKFILITVSKADSRQRSAFVTQFNKAQLSSGGIEQAFEESLKESKQQYGVLDFKARLIKRK